jgi:hypothetical protein
MIILKIVGGFLFNFLYFVILISLLMVSQEDSGTHQRSKFSSPRFQGPLFQNQLLPIFSCSVQSLFLETTLVLLEKLSVQCHSVLHDNCHWYIIWSHLLEQRTKDVSRSSDNINLESDILIE